MQCRKSIKETQHRRGEVQQIKQKFITINYFKILNLLLPSQAPGLPVIRHALRGEETNAAHMAINLPLTYHYKYNPKRQGMKRSI